MKTKTIFTFLIVAILVFSGCVQQTDNNTNTPDNSYDLQQPTGDLKKFSSVAAIKEFLENSTQSASYETYGRGTWAMEKGGMMLDSIDMDFAAESISNALGAPTDSATEYSTTNIQVKGVDEPDFIKNDNKYIYIISGEKLVIADAYPPGEAKIISETLVDGTAENIFINKDRLVVFTRKYDTAYIIDQYDYIPRSRSVQKTHALVYDISDKETPELIKDYNLDGQFYQARMIDKYIYFIVKENTYYYTDFINVPVLREQTTKLITPDIYYFDDCFEDNYVFNTIASFNIFDNTDSVNAKTFLLGNTNNLYVSKDNIYITYRKNMPYNYHRYSKKEAFFKVVVPLLPKNIQDEINTINSKDDLDDYEKWQVISEKLQDMYNEMEDESQKSALVKEIEEALLEYETKQEEERQKTIIHKINIDKGEITYKTKGEIPGTLLNQFSMDEYDENFRTATTTTLWIRNKGQVQYNNVYVLDKDMKIIGEITNIAPDEKIYSCRFIGDRLYMVTFKRIDPFFVIDLSEPKNPKILGELKIPGYSDYLHPYDDNHIIGIGKETDTNQWGGTSIKGVKIALFDVSDVENPKQIDMYEIGTSGTDSEALRDHKAFLFDKGKDILVMPITEVEGDGYRNRNYWYGAYVLGISPEDGITKKGKITHLDYTESKYYNYYSPYNVRRSLYMDDYLYTISSKKIKMNNIEDIEEELNVIDLPYNDNNRYW